MLIPESSSVSNTLMLGGKKEMCIWNNVSFTDGLIALLRVCTSYNEINAMDSSDALVVVYSSDGLDEPFFISSSESAAFFAEVVNGFFTDN